MRVYISEGRFYNRNHTDKAWIPVTEAGTTVMTAAGSAPDVSGYCAAFLPVWPETQKAVKSGHHINPFINIRPEQCQPEDCKTSRVAKKWGHVILAVTAKDWLVQCNLVTHENALPG